MTEHPYEYLGPHQLLTDLKSQLAEIPAEFPEARKLLERMIRYVEQTAVAPKTLLRGRGSAVSCIKHVQASVDAHLAATDFTDEQKMALAAFREKTGLPRIKEKLRAETAEATAELGW
jgi:hypothetical protein